MSDLTTKMCQPCEGGIPKMDQGDVALLLPQIPKWSVVDDGNSIERRINAGTFVGGVQRVGQICELAEQQQHHPDLHLTGYRHLRIVLTTHAIGGLSENDFILAAKLDQLLDD